MVEAANPSLHCLQFSPSMVWQLGILLFAALLVGGVDVEVVEGFVLDDGFDVVVVVGVPAKWE